MTLQFNQNVQRALEFMMDHPGGRNRRLTAEEGKDGGSPTWVSVAMNFDSQREARLWASFSGTEREGKDYSDVLGYYKAEFPWGLVYAHFPKTDLKLAESQLMKLTL